MDPENTDLDMAAVNHACHVVRRAAEEETPDLALEIILHSGEDIKSVLANKVHTFHMVPALKRRFETMPDDRDSINEQNGFLAVGRWRKKRWFWPAGQDRYVAVFLLNKEIFADVRHVRMHMWHMIWHASQSVERFKKGEAPSGDFIPLSHGVGVEEAYNNMLADVFAAVMTRGPGSSGAVRALARMRCRFALEARPGYRAEAYPYPLAAEAVQSVMEEKNIAGAPVSMAQAIEVAEEVRHSFDHQSVSHWQDFARAAQYMAWSGFARNKILQAAIHTSEDPYLRSMAYLAAEILNSEPAPITDFQEYNPFAPPEVNARVHDKRARKALEAIITLPADKWTESIEAMIAAQNEALMRGQMMGWCVPALKALQDIAPEESNADTMQSVFEEALRKADWDSVLSTGQTVLNLYREGKQHKIQQAVTRFLKF